MNQPTEILVRGPNWAGDVVMATPAFRALRAGFPEARISLHLRESLLPLLAASPWFDELLPLRSYHRGLSALLAEARELRGVGYDLGLCLPDSFSAALLMRLGGCARVVGYRRGGRRLLLHQAVPVPEGFEQEGRLMLARERHVLGLVRAVGCPERGTQLELFVSPAEEAALAERLATLGVAADASLAVLAPGASYGPSKLWPAESFARVGDALVDAGASVVLVGSPAEGPLVARVASLMRRPAAQLGDELGLGGLKALLRRSRVLVCNDAGARHVAVAFGVPCVVPMGPTSLAKTNLNLEQVTVLTADVACRPCYQRVCPIDHRCMTRITPESVTAHALRAFQAHTPARSAAVSGSGA